MQDEIVQFKPDYIKKTSITLNHYDVFLDSDLLSSENYRDLLLLLFRASDHDSITIHINCHGGNIDSAMAIIEGIKNTSAAVSANVIGACHSAASIILMYINDVVIFESSYCMIHSASYGTFGMSSNVKSHTDFIYAQIDKIFDKCYEGFLSKEEIDSVKKGSELWFDAEQMMERMKKRQEFLAKEFEEEEQGE